MNHERNSLIFRSESGNHITNIKVILHWHRGQGGLCRRHLTKDHKKTNLSKWNMWKYNAATSQVFTDCFDCRTHIWISFVRGWEVLWRALRIWRPSPQTPFKRNFYSHQTFLIAIIIINVLCPKAFEKKILFIQTLHYPCTSLYSPSFSFQTWKWKFYPHIEFSPPDICDVEKSFFYSSPPYNYPTVDRLQFPF